MGRPWRGIITQANVQIPETPPGPGEEAPTPRIFEAFTWREPPFTLRAVFVDTYGHMQAAPVARVDRVWNDGDDVWAEGVFSDVPDGQNAETLVAEQILNAVSVDPSDYAMVEEWIDPETQQVVPAATLEDLTTQLYAAWDDEDEARAVEIMTYLDSLYVRLRFPRYEIGGATLTAIQAVTRARIQIVEDAPADQAPADGAPPLQASALPADDLAALAARTPVLSASEAARLTGPTNPDGSPRSLAAQLRARFDARPRRTPARTLQAAGGPARRPAAAYRMQNLSGPTPFGITDEGWFVGHVAVRMNADGSLNCHRSLSIGGACVVPPVQDTFEEAHGGTTYLDDGTQIRTGVLTYADLHAAPGGLSVAEIQRLIEDTGTQLGSVRYYADRWGVQACGVAHEGRTPEELAVAVASTPSGDWRMKSGEYRLFGIHLVNTGGLIVREGLVDGEQRMVASMMTAADLAADEAAPTSCGCGGSTGDPCSCGQGLTAADLADLASLDLAQQVRRRVGTGR